MPAGFRSGNRAAKAVKADPGATLRRCGARHAIRPTGALFLLAAGGDVVPAAAFRTGGELLPLFPLSARLAVRQTGFRLGLALALPFAPDAFIKSKPRQHARRGRPFDHGSAG